MRFTCEKNTLLTGLNITGRTVAQKSAISAIEGILCKAGDGLSLTGHRPSALTIDVHPTLFPRSGARFLCRTERRGGESARFCQSNRCEKGPASQKKCGPAVSNGKYHVFTFQSH